MHQSIPRRKKMLFSWDAQKVKEKKLMITLFLAHPKLADSDPKGRYVSIIKDTHTHIIATQIYETMFVAAISMMLSNDLLQQYKVGNSAGHFK